MEFLLKIVEGAAKGAEIALVGGMRLKLGRGEDCDIVVNDASLGDTACELDVGDSAVTLLVPGAAPVEMKPYEIHRLGAVAIAAGPLEGEWENLRESVKKEEPPAEEKPAEPPPAGEAAEAKPEAAPEPAADAANAEPWWKKLTRRLLMLAACGLAVVLALLVILIVLICRGCGEGQTRGRRGFSTASFAEVAGTNGISIVESNGVRTVRGNLKRRTERLAIRALALAEDRSFRFDLTDDETLRECAESLLYVVTESCVKPAVATNRVLELSGFVPSEAAAAAVELAIRSDVPGVKTVLWDRVDIGGAAPEAVSATAFARTGEPAKADSVVAESVAIARPAAKSPATDGRLRFNQPYAGVIVKPYPCVVLANGLKLVEGASVGGAEIVSIDEEKIVVRENGKLVERWL